jgi:hypothetical protein
MNPSAESLHSPAIRAFIREHSYLFWYTPEDKKDEISEELLVETILNYGNLDDIRKLIDLLGIHQVAGIFRTADKRRKMNYFPEIYNYFLRVFERYA